MFEFFSWIIGIWRKNDSSQVYKHLDGGNIQAAARTVEAMVRENPTEAVGFAILALEFGMPNSRCLGALALGYLGSRGPVGKPWLLEMARAFETDERVRAISALWRVSAPDPDAEVFGALTRALKDPSWGVRARAAEGIANCDPYIRGLAKEALEEMLRMEDSGDDDDALAAERARECARRALSTEE